MEFISVSLSQRCCVKALFYCPHFTRKAVPKFLHFSLSFFKSVTRETLTRISWFFFSLFSPFCYTTQPYIWRCVPPSPFFRYNSLSCCRAINLLSSRQAQKKWPRRRFSKSTDWRQQLSNTLNLLWIKGLYEDTVNKVNIITYD